MSWFVIAIIAHILSAVAFFIDKFILSKTAFRPVVYSFFVGTLGIWALLLIPFGFTIPTLWQVITALSAGWLFVLAILFFYKSIRKNEISTITPIIGGSVPVFTIILTYIFLGERLTSNQLIAFFLLVLGGLIMLWVKSNNKSRTRLSKALLSAFLFASSFVLTKSVYTHQAFIDGFIWTRLGGVLGACFLLIFSQNRQLIKKTIFKAKAKVFGLPIFSKIISASAFVLLNYAIYLGSVSLVNALQGVQYFFLFIVALILSKKFPQILEEKINTYSIIKKTTAIILISSGLIILAYGI